VEADTQNTTSHLVLNQGVRTGDLKPTVRSVADRKVRSTGVGSQCGDRSLFLSPSGDPQSQIGCHPSKSFMGREPPVGRGGQSPPPSAALSRVKGIPGQSRGGTDAEKVPLACQYRNKWPHVATKGVTGSVSDTGAYSPKYINACRAGAWSIVTWPVANPDQVKFRQFKCRSWRHEGECSQWKGAQDFARISSALKKNRGSWTYLVQTFARDREFRNSYEAYKGLFGCWPKLRKRLTRKWGDFKYIALAEKHRDGWPHLNLLIRNEALAEACSEDGWKSVRKNWLEPHAVKSGFGMRTWIEPVRDAEAMSGYFVKLCGTAGEFTKSSQSPDNAPKNFRRLRASQGLLPPPHKNPDFTGCLEKEPLEIAEHRWETIKEKSQMIFIDGKKHLDVEEFATEIRVSSRTVWRWLTLDPPLPSVKVGPNRGPGCLLLVPSKLGHRWVKDHAPVPPPGRTRKYHLLQKGESE